MKKRITLLSKKDGMTDIDFRSYWAGPHASLALCMDGIERYVQNRVDKLLWAKNDMATFKVDGVVELQFSDEVAMRKALASEVASRYIPADEPHFLRGWTLCIVNDDVDAGAAERKCPSAKVIVPFLLRDDVRRANVAKAFERAGVEAGAQLLLSWTESTARRDVLWCEPQAPHGFAFFWFAQVAAAHKAFDANGVLSSTFDAQCGAAVALLIDELTVR